MAATSGAKPAAAQACWISSWLGDPPSLLAVAGGLLAVGGVVLVRPRPRRLAACCPYERAYGGDTPQ
ncbi:hypothetical protein [Actinomadura sp.]|uniref:hypothetical protein n=1 Tax=Actinomadura sp. TaxID=1989 RepID=UPI0037CB5C18